MEECTFQPNINHNSQVMPSSSHSVIARTQQWQKQRNARMRQEREAQEKKEMEECTFRPNIGAYKPKKGRAKKKEAYGVDSHLDRQAAARKRKEDAAAIPHSTGENWNGKLTKPEEFSFNHKVKIKALSKPITPAVVEAKIENKLDEEYLRAIRGGDDYGASQSQGYGTSAEWLRRAAEKEQSESAHAAAGMLSPRYYASDALNVHTGTPRGRTGEDTHVSRMKAARDERRAKEAASKSTTGEHWKGGTTKPQEFKFADSKAVRVKALHKPVSPMLY
jgi:hypothetical protein